MSKFSDMVNADMSHYGQGIMRLVCSATLAWTDEHGLMVGTSSTSGIYRMKAGDNCITAINAGGDDNAIIYLPPVHEAAGRHYFIIAPTAATADDISLYVTETQAELSTNGDMDADGDHILLYSTGAAWLTRLDGVA